VLGHVPSSLYLVTLALAAAVHRSAANVDGEIATLDLLQQGLELCANGAVPLDSLLADAIETDPSLAWLPLFNRQHPVLPLSDPTVNPAAQTVSLVCVGYRLCELHAVRQQYLPALAAARTVLARLAIKHNDYGLLTCIVVTGYKSETAAVDRLW
jgi:hypothetical protein